MKRKEDATVKLRELGTLPTAELEALATLKRKALVERLSSVHDKLKQYGHVNKRATDQYTTFTEQREQLEARKKELDSGDSSIRDLVSSLDDRKDEAIMRTFKGVQKHFKEVFAELVPKGSASMILKTSADGNDDGADNDGGSRSKKGAEARVERFKGLAIQVSFTDAGESKSINSLSGGQKSLVALALIFAIQRTDPAPFYVFDEVDSALDATHRAAVGALIKKQSDDEENPAQFITSTFAPEIVNHGDHFFGTVLEHKVSRVEEMDSEAALAFVYGIQEEEKRKAPGSASRAVPVDDASSMQSSKGAGQSARKKPRQSED